MGSEEKIKLPEIKLLFTATCVLKAVKKKKYCHLSKFLHWNFRKTVFKGKWMHEM